MALTPILGRSFTVNSLLSELKSTDNTTKMPVLFVGHGSPMNALEENLFTQKWVETAKNLPKPTAILCISAHWLTRGTFVTAMENPKTIHDFGGFPKALFDVEYPAKGSPELALETQKMITKTHVELDHEWGLDHGTWSILAKMYPMADIPVLQLSIDYYQPAQFHYDLGKELGLLRNKGVLIVGSGNMVHNLGLARFGKDPSFGFEWALEMNDIFKKNILDKNHQALINYQKLSSSATLAVPTPDHYFPLLYILGLQQANENTEIFNDSTVLGSLSMTSVKIVS